LKDLGLAVSSHEGQPAEFELCWLLDRPWAAAEFYFAGANFAGEALTPSRFWLLGAHAKTNWKNAVSPRESRLDELQNSRLNELGASRKWSKAKLKSLSETLQVDLGQAPLQAIQRPPQSLSASSIERYQVCPFAFAAQRVFRLNDEPCLDLDLDRMSRGRLMHRIFADLGIEPFRIDWTEEELLALIEKARVDEEIQFAEPQMWPPLQQAHLKLTRQFLRLEKDWRSRFPKLRTVATELPFECAWDMEEKNWVEFTGAPNQIRFSGRIDRIDSDGEGHYSLIDYKSTVNNLRHWTSWLENDQLQLAIYAELIEKGLTTLPDGRVESAVYYVCKAESRNKGFYLKEASENLFEFDSRVRNQISLEDRKNLLAGVHEKIGATIDHIRAGYFSPLPKKLSTCDECNWSRLCRAPHLN
jgi:ATP-dependent helicase/DNAse subunit B